MNIVILGSNGMLGSMLNFIGKTEYLQHNIISLCKSDFNVICDNIYKLKKYIDSSTCIINCIGAIPQKSYAPEEYEHINVRFPIELSNFCKDNNIKLIHISTNCVFSSNKSLYSESDTPNAEDIYGKSKSQGEPSYGNIIRCSIIGPERFGNFGLLEWFLNVNQQTVKGFTDSYWNGITTLELSRIIFDTIHINDTSSTIHYYSENIVSKYELLNYIGKVYNKCIDIQPYEYGLKYYTLTSNKSVARKNIYQQIDELYSITPKFRVFYS